MFQWIWRDPVLAASSSRCDEILASGSRRDLVMLLTACQAREAQIRARLAEIDRQPDRHDEPLTLPAAAKLLGCSTDKVRELAREGKLKTYRLGRAVRTTRESVERARWQSS